MKHSRPLCSVNTDMLYQVTSLVENYPPSHANTLNSKVANSCALCVIFGEVILTQRSMETTVNVICRGMCPHYKTIMQENRFTQGD